VHVSPTISITCVVTFIVIALRKLDWFTIRSGGKSCATQSGACVSVIDENMYEKS
jgi:hypothetical protein